MDGLALSTATTTSTTIAHSSLFGNGFSFSSIHRKSTTVKRRILWFPKRTQFVVLAAKDEPRFDQYDQMELKFGRMIGEDPKLTLAKKPEVKTRIDESSASEGEPVGTKQELERDSVLGMQPLERTDFESNPNEETVENDQDAINLADVTANIPAESPLLGKPKRLDQSVRVALPPVTEEALPVNHDGYGNASSEVKDLPTTSPSEDVHWSRAEKLHKSGDRVEVELISSSIGGFAVSFGSLVGFLPYRNLSTKWKFLAFESWLKQKGLDPSKYRKQLGIIGTHEATENNMSLDSNTIPKVDGKNAGEITPDMKLEDLLRIYDQEKLKFLSSFIGQRIKVNILMVNRNSRKLIVSLRPKEKEEMVEKKRSIMARLQIGDVVKCCIKKITYFGIFVEIEGVPALIHQSEVSWDATLDPGSYFKVGQTLEAKVHQLDIALERIFLSLKEITPDPLMGALESVIDGDRDSFGANLQAAEADTEWADVESLVKELQQIEGIQFVTKGRFFLSPGLAPTFQVYMASMFENQYKLLARSENKVQEVIVHASLSKEEMKSTILACTNRVE